MQVFNMGDDRIFLHLHHGGKFVKGRKLKYEGGSCKIIEPIDVDRLSYFEKSNSQNSEIKTPPINNSNAQSPTIKRPATVTQSENLRTRSQTTKVTAQDVDYDWEDPRPESPLTWNNLVGGHVGSLDDDSDEHLDGEEDDDSDSNWVHEGVVTDDVDDNGAGEEPATNDSDDEWQMAKAQVGEFRK
ncbi:hypothetical protein Cgig2_004256 [Carnegiea gigantea]|uniref:PB1-like domain-containing protein n=1 Tax=Carnegiea gigantea TaxID=171969 RepID=A0A9Q1KF25_9CARY|nr:hypothetical protein Cgig2_004256 [Carnegiea gigantea]